MSENPTADGLTAEDAKLITLARGARERIQAPTGVAVRDDMGRTYAAADAVMPSVTVPALTLVLGQAWISGGRHLEAVVIVLVDTESNPDIDFVFDMARDGTEIIRCAADGTVLDSTTVAQLRPPTSRP